MRPAAAVRALLPCTRRRESPITVLMLRDTDPTLTARLDRIKNLSDELIRVQNACQEAKAIAIRIHLEVEETRAALNVPEPEPDQESKGVLCGTDNA